MSNDNHEFSSTDEHRILVEEKVDVLKECAVSIGKRKRHVQGQLQDAVQQEMELSNKIVSMQERIENLRTTRQRQQKLKDDLRRTLSKSRERLSQTVLEYPLSAMDANSTRTFSSDTYKSDIKALLEASTHEFLPLDMDAKLSGKQAWLRLQSMKRTCLDLHIMVSPSHAIETDSNIQEETVQRSGFDPNIPLCPFELNGVCSDPYCQYQHLSESRPTVTVIDPVLIPLLKLKLPPLDNKTNLEQMEESSTQVIGNVIPNDILPKAADTFLSERENDADGAKGGSSIELPLPIASLSFENPRVSDEEILLNERERNFGPFIQQTLDHLQKEIHMGRYPIPKTSVEFTDLALHAASIDRVASVGHPHHKLYREAIRAIVAESCMDVEIAQHGTENVFHQTFTVQRILQSIPIPSQGPLQRFTSPPRLPSTATIRDMVDQYLPKAISHLQLQQQEQQYEDADVEHAPAAAALYIGEVILDVLKHVASLSIVSNQQKPDGMLQSFSSAARSEYREVFDAIGVILDDFLRGNDFKESPFENQLIMAPVWAAHISLGCFLRQFQVVQERMEQLMSLIPVQDNWFLRSELLWSQLIQLQLCLPSYEVQNDPLATIAVSHRNVQEPQNHIDASSSFQDTSPPPKQRGIPKEIVDRYEVITTYVGTLGVAIRNLKPTIGFRL